MRAATVPRTESVDPLPARFALELRPSQDPAAVRRRGRTGSGEHGGARVSPLSALDPEMLLLDLLDRALAAARPAACFAAGYALADRFDLVGAEPDLPTAFFPEHDTAAEVFTGEGAVGLPARLLGRPGTRAGGHP